MHLQLDKENFNQTLNRFSTSELETLVEKFPYFQQAHLLLAKKYQQQNDPRFDQQLQLAALYTQDRDLLFSIFNEKAIAMPVIETVITKADEEDLTSVAMSENEPLVVEEVKTPEIVEPILETSGQSVEPIDESKIDQPGEQEGKEVILSEFEPVVEADMDTEAPNEEFLVNEPHTFNEWLQAFSKTEAPKLKLHQEQIPIEPEKQDEELEKLYVANIPVNLQELVEEETHYSKGLDKFIEEQIQKHKAPGVKMPAYENELAPELITETMARVYEMQKKYLRAIRCYEILALKYPEKNDFFAARINYLKNII